MAGPQKARGFTLVELLVVITIIGMLMALLLPAIQQAREAGRRNTCSNNMHNLGTALMLHEGSKRSFPGYVNVVANKRASWIIPILPQLERNDLYQNWQASSMPAAVPASMSMAPTASPWAHTQLALLVCPSNPGNLGSNPLSYVVNTGSANTASDNFPPVTSPTWLEDINSGVFFNQSKADWAPMATAANPNPYATTGFGAATNMPIVKVSLDFVTSNDGSSNTLMLGENLQSSNWATDPTALSTNELMPFQSDFQVRQQAGFVWFITGANVNNAEPPTSAQASGFNINAYKINGIAKSVSVPIPNTAFNAAATVPVGGNGGLAFARPSSSHPGGSNFYFCDNHYRFISEDIPYHVYTQLMTSKNTGVRGNPASGYPASGPYWIYLPSEADY
jgi:prepilin-type N-terminal cleavage/methylation domain-containing protein